MTRGKHSNQAHAVLDRADDCHATPRPGDSPGTTARTVLVGCYSMSAPNCPRTRAVNSRVGRDRSPGDRVWDHRRRWPA